MPGSKKLYRYKSDCGRMGEVEGLFIATDEEIHKIICKEIYFGEILGKHSEVILKMQEGDFETLSDDQKFLEKLEDLLGDTLSGYNPLEYYQAMEGE